MHTGSLRKIVAIAALGAAGCGVDTSQNGKVKITSVTPDTSSITGGIVVEIGGKGFDGGSEPTVVFGPNAADVLDYSENLISVTLPGGLGCGNVDIQINNPVGFAIDESGFTYTGGNGVIAVTNVTPTLGDIAGGTEITITGSGFTGGAGVLLDGQPMEQIEVVSDTEIRATTPQQINGGIADLQVRNCADEETLPGAFLFTSNLNGGYVELPLVQFANAAQYADPPPSNYINPFVAFVEPTTESLLNPIPNLDTCLFNPPAPAPGTFVLQDAGADVTLASGTQNVTLDLQSDTSYYYPQGDADALTTGKFVFNAPYSVSAAGNATVPSFVAPGAFTTPADFTLSAPVINTDPPTPVARGQRLFTWNATAPGDFFQIILRGYNNAGAATNEQLECYVVDDGSYQVATADMNKLAAATQFEVFAIRRTDTSFILPSNGSNAVGVGMVYKRGIVYFNP